MNINKFLGKMQTKHDKLVAKVSNPINRGLQKTYSTVKAVDKGIDNLGLGLRKGVKKTGKTLDKGMRKFADFSDVVAKKHSPFGAMDSATRLVESKIAEKKSKKKLSALKNRLKKQKRESTKNKY